jgi:hypothetical protein
MLFTEKCHKIIGMKCISHHFFEREAFRMPKKK